MSESLQDDLKKRAEGPERGREGVVRLNDGVPEVFFPDYGKCKAVTLQISDDGLKPAEPPQKAQSRKPKKSD